MSPAEKLQQASHLIRAQRYQEARAILETIPDHPKAQEWMAKIDDILFQQDPFADTPFTDDDIAAYALGEKPKRKHVYVEATPITSPKRDYALMAVIAMFLYWVFWLPGFGMNIYFLMEARREKRETGVHPGGLGCLWWLLFFNVIVPVVFCCLIITLAAVVPLDEIIATPTKITPR